MKKVRLENGQVAENELVRDADGNEVKARDIPVGSCAWLFSMPGRALTGLSDYALGRRLEDA